MQLKALLLGLSLCCVSASSFAADQLIKEETTPSTPEGALTADQIQPVFMPKPATAPQQQQPVQTQTTTTNQPASSPPANATPAPNNQPASLQ
jgi:hypothetical protein